MELEFVKMHGLGNDYIYFDCIKEPDKISEPQELSVKLSNRHFSIGGDGVILLLPSDKADFKMRIFNADGSEAEMCGNGIRCAVKLFYETGYTTSKTIKVETKAGILALELTCDSQNSVKFVKVNMGKPRTLSAEIPLNTNLKNFINKELKLETVKYNATVVSMGNPHAVIFTDEITDKQVLSDGPQLEKHPIFPNRANIEFVKVISPSRVKMRVWERGSGETLACGTGASAVVVASILNKKTETKVTVELIGGELNIEWAEDGNIYMSGPAEISFSGKVKI